MESATRPFHSAGARTTKTKRTTKDLCLEATNFVAQRNDLTCVAAVMLETRKDESRLKKQREDISRLNKRNRPKAGVRDFYCEGLKYLIQRAAEEVVEASLQGCVVICDTPELGKKSFAAGAIRRGPGAVENAYRDWYRSGVRVGPSKQHHEGPLARIGFQPSVLTGDATYHDMLQIADVVAGVTREWVDAVRTNHSSSWELDRFKAVSVRFRRRHGNPDFFGDGFILWPWQNQLWASLKRSVK